MTTSSLMTEIKKNIYLANTKRINKKTMNYLYKAYVTREIRPKLYKEEKEEKDFKPIEEQINNLYNLFPNLKKVSLNKFPYYLLHNIKNIIHKIKYEDGDAMLLCYATEGKGKSTLGYWACTAADPNFNYKKVIFDTDQFFKYVTDLIESITLDTGKKTFKAAIKEIELNKDKYRHLRGQAVLLDEGVSMLFTRNAMKGENKEIMEFFTIMRLLGMFVWVNAVGFNLMEKDIRTRRAYASIVLTKKGECGIIPRKYQSWIQYNDSTKEVKYPWFRVKDEYTKLSGDEWANYQSKKAEFVANKAANFSKDEDQEANEYQFTPEELLTDNQLETFRYLKLGMKQDEIQYKTGKDQSLISRQKNRIKEIFKKNRIEIPEFLI